MVRHEERRRAAGIHAVSLANNHTLDYGYDAPGERLAMLDAAGIAPGGRRVHAGGGHAPGGLRGGRDAHRPLACTDNEPEWEAAPDRAGTFYVPIALSDPLAERVFTLVRRTKADADLVVVALYWGANWGDAPVAHIPCAAR